jgi:membrane fusion protein (multidrug efflux system)
VEKRPLGRQTEFIGRVQAFEKVDLRARVQGFLLKQAFQAGAQVNAEQTLFEIERAPFEAVLAQKQAQLAAAEATLKQSAAQLARYRALRNREVASEAQLDLQIAEEARARAAVLEAKAAILDAEVKLSYTTIKAPITGRIGREMVTPGNLVGPETGVLATVVRTDKMYVLFPVTQVQLIEARRRTAGAPLTVQARLADGTLLPTKGKIDFLDVTVDPRTDGQLVRAVFENADGALSDGQTMRLVIEQTAPEEVTAIPLAAVSTDQQGPFVYLVNAGDVVERRMIKLGQQRDGLVSVQQGLAPGDRVIVQGQQKVRPGVKVAPQPSSEGRSARSGAMQ